MKYCFSVLEPNVESIIVKVVCAHYGEDFHKFLRCVESEELRNLFI